MHEHLRIMTWVLLSPHKGSDSRRQMDRRARDGTRRSSDSLLRVGWLRADVHATDVHVHVQGLRRSSHRCVQF